MYFPNWKIAVRQQCLGLWSASKPARNPAMSFLGSLQRRVDPSYSIPHGIKERLVLSRGLGTSPSRGWDPIGKFLHPRRWLAGPPSATLIGLTAVCVIAGVPAHWQMQVDMPLVSACVAVDISNPNHVYDILLSGGKLRRSCI